VESLLASIESTADAESVANVRELVATILELHRTGLERLADRFGASEEAAKLTAKLRADDPLVDCLFDLHDIPLGAPGPRGPVDPGLVQLRVPKKPPAVEQTDRCERCGAAMPEAHEHLFEKGTGTLVCACAACAVAGAIGHVRVPQRTRWLRAFDLPDALWDALGIPVQLAFIAWSSRRGAPLAHYPSPAGAIEAAVSEEAWAELAARNPVLRTLEADVEALLVWRTKDTRDHFTVPIDVGYKLVGIVRKEGPSVLVSRSASALLERTLERLKAAAEA
jgi:hypothetical protein